MNIFKTLNEFIIPQKFKIRHLILQYAKEKLELDKGNDIRTNELKEVFSQFNTKLLTDQIYVLLENKDIEHLKPDNRDIFFITKKGFKSCSDEEYIEAGITFIYNRYYDYGKNILVLLAVLTFFLSTYQGCNNKKAIEIIEQRIHTLEQKK